jgi:hypothetical protein
MTKNVDAIPSHVYGLLETTRNGVGDSDRHILPLFAIALASKGTCFVELGVRDGTTTLPLLLAAALNGGRLISVDRQPTSFDCPAEYESHWQFVQADAVEFLQTWDTSHKVDIVYIDDWHAYSHVAKELEYVDRMVGPSSIVLVHDLMYGTEPFYHTDMALKHGQWADGGPYRAVAELPDQFWEWSTLPWSNGLTILRKKYSRKYHRV